MSQFRKSWTRKKKIFILTDCLVDKFVNQFKLKMKKKWSALCHLNSSPANKTNYLCL